MSLNVELVGKIYPPSDPYVVGREKVREFATATGQMAPVHHDLIAARAAGYPDVLAPTTFAVLIAQRADARAVADPELGMDFTRVVHGEQTVTLHQPLCAGETVHTTTVIDSIRMMAGNALVTLRDELVDDDGGAIATCVSMLVVRAEES